MTTSPFQVPTFRISQLAPLTRSSGPPISRLVTTNFLPASREDPRTHRRHQSREPSTRRPLTIHVMCYGAVSSLRGYVLDDRAAVERLVPAWGAPLKRRANPRP